MLKSVNRGRPRVYDYDKLKAEGTLKVSLEGLEKKKKRSVLANLRSGPWKLGMLVSIKIMREAKNRKKEFAVVTLKGYREGWNADGKL